MFNIFFSWHSFFSLYYHLPFPGNLKFKHDLNTMRKIVNSVIAKKRKVILQENKTGDVDIPFECVLSVLTSIKLFHSVG